MGILYRARLIIPRKQLNQLYFSFFHKLCYLNCANLAWSSTQKTKVSATYPQQNHSIRLTRFKDKFTRPRPLLKEIGTLSIHQINIFNN